MKKLLLITFTFITSLVFAQTQHGKFLIGAYGNLNSSISKSTYDLSNEETTTSSIATNLKGGYFLIDNLNVGLQASYNSSRLKYETFDYNLNTNYYSIGPFVRYYLLKGNIKPYLESSFGVGKSISKQESDAIGDNESESTFSFYNLGGGVAIFIHKIISLDLGLNYGFNEFEDEENNNSETNSYSFSVGFSFYL